MTSVCVLYSDGAVAMLCLSVINSYFISVEGMQEWWQYCLMARLYCVSTGSHSTLLVVCQDCSCMSLLVCMPVCQYTSSNIMLVILHILHNNLASPG